jgi:hypothetical protein
VAATRTLGGLLWHLQGGTGLSSSTMGLLLGVVLWVFLYMVLPRPVVSYVLAHELTHALWGYLMGAGVSRLRVSGKGGSVVVSKSNIFITLAPYFFPFYTVVVILLHGVLWLFVDMRGYEPLWMGFVGLTWAFHATFTLSMLAGRQPDIEAYGRVFSYTMIYLMNVLGVCLWVVATSSPTLGMLVDRLGADLAAVWFALRGLGAWLAGRWGG